jgi:hypothetical protein
MRNAEAIGLDPQQHPRLSRHTLAPVLPAFFLEGLSTR